MADAIWLFLGGLVLFFGGLTLWYQVNKKSKSRIDLERRRQEDRAKNEAWRNMR